MRALYYGFTFAGLLWLLGTIIVRLFYLLSTTGIHPCLSF